MIRPALPYDELDEILRGDGRSGYVGLSAIDVLIAAVVAGPRVLPSTTWLPPIFGNEMPGSSLVRSMSAWSTRF